VYRVTDEPLIFPDQYPDAFRAFWAAVLPVPVMDETSLA
jgi:hypothetical protein